MRQMLPQMAELGLIGELGRRHEPNLTLAFDRSGGDLKLVERSGPAECRLDYLAQGSARRALSDILLHMLLQGGELCPATITSFFGDNYFFLRGTPRRVAMDSNRCDRLTLALQGEGGLEGKGVNVFSFS